jgi:AAT family amino acid transporter
MTLLTHLAFRRATRRASRKYLRIAPRGPYSSLCGVIALLGVLVSTWWIPDFHVTLLAGPPWLLFITFCYFAWKETKHAPPQPAGPMRSAVTTEAPR